MKIALAQLNPTIGDFDGNLRLLEEALARAEAAGAELLVTSELPCAATRRAICWSGRPSSRRRGAPWSGWPAGSRGTAVVVGFPEAAAPGSATGRRIANSAALLHQGRVVSVHRKSLLPTYDVFDEWRYFEPATEVACVELGGPAAGHLDLRGHLERRRLLAAAAVPRGSHREAGGQRAPRS